MAHVWVALGLVGLLAVGLATRLPGLDEPPLDFHPTRQYHGALIARSYADRIAWDRSEVESRRIQATKPTEVEPPALELATAFAHAVAGSEGLWVPRFISVVAWLAGAPLLLALGWRLHSGMAGLVAAVVHVLLPYGVQASRSIQPDPLFTTAIVGFALAAVAFGQRPGRRAAALVLVTGAFTIFLKVVGVFFVVPIALAVWWVGRRRDSSPRLLVAGGAAVLLGMLYTAFGLLLGTAATQTGGRVVPQLLWDPWFWSSWYQRADEVVSWPLLLTIAVSLLVVRRPLLRAVLMAWTGGYVAFGLVFTYHYATHDYYHLPLVPLAGLAAGSLGAELWSRMETAVVRHAASILGAVLAVAMVVGALRAVPTPAPELVAGRIDVWTRAGVAAEHSTNSILLTEFHARPLMYYGLVSGSQWWPSWARELDVRRGMRPESQQEQFERLLRRDPEFFVVTDMVEWESDPRLRELLEPFPVRRGPGYLVFDLRDG